MNALSIDRSEKKAHGRTGACPLRGSMGNRAPISHHKFKARSPSLSRRNWGGAMTRSAHFLSRAGWGCSLDALADIRTRILAKKQAMKLARSRGSE